MARDYTHRNPSPQNDRRACLCPDGTYSRKCCDGSFQAQGIGNITGHIHTTPYQGYEVQNCVDSHVKHVHLHGSLNVGSVYYLELENGNIGCFTVLRELGSEGIHINTSTLYADCSACTVAN